MGRMWRRPTSDEAGSGTSVRGTVESEIAALMVLSCPPGFVYKASVIDHCVTMLCSDESMLC